MSDYISKSALKKDIIAELPQGRIKAVYLELVDNQPTVDEKEIIRKTVEMIVERVEEKINDIEIQYENNYEKGITDGIDYAMQIVEEEGGISE